MEHEQEVRLPEIVVSYADVLTRPLFYPQNVFSKALTDLMRRKTFTKLELEQLQRMGFKVTVKNRMIEVPNHHRPILSDVQDS